MHWREQPRGRRVKMSPIFKVNRVKQGKICSLALFHVLSLGPYMPLTYKKQFGECVTLLPMILVFVKFGVNM